MRKYMAEISNEKIMYELGKLQGMVEEGFDGMNKRLDEGTKRMDSHDIRIKVTEIWQATATGKVAMIGAVVSIAAAFIGNLIIKAFIAPSQ